MKPLWAGLLLPLAEFTLLAGVSLRRVLDKGGRAVWVGCGASDDGWLGCGHCTVHVLRLALLLSFRRCRSGVLPFLGLSDRELDYSACQVTK